MDATVAARRTSARWPELPYGAWKDTMATLHMQLQVIGKLRLALAPFEPQWANVPLYLTARGLTTTPMRAGEVTFEVRVDLLDHDVTILTTQGAAATVSLTPGTVADFYQELMETLHELGISVAISRLPSEVPSPIRFDLDTIHRTYDPQAVSRFFSVLSQVDLVLKTFRARFRGKTPPLAFFWGTFDLYLSLHSGRLVSPPANAGTIYRGSADAEVVCAGFWPGSDRLPLPAFFGYAYPRPDGLEEEPVGPAGAYWNRDLGEFILPYDDVRQAREPEDAILEFCQSVYAAGAKRAGFDPALMRPLGD